MIWHLPRSVLAIGVAVVLSLLLSACGNGDGPRARGGILDLGRWDFRTGGPVELAGEWGFSWGSDPTSAFAGMPGELMIQPGVWNRAQGTFHPSSGVGRAVLSLRVRLPDGAPPLALAIPDVNSAYRLHVNGRPTLAVGKLGDDAVSEIPVFRRPVVEMPAGMEVLDIVLEISNHHHFEGGIGRPLLLGPTADLQRARMLTRVVPLAAVGALAVVLAMQLAFWAGGRRERAFLVFAAFTVLFILRTQASGGLYSLVEHDLPADPWYLVPSYLTLFAFPGVYLLFLRELFPAEAPRRLVWSFMTVSAAGMLAVFLLPPTLYTRLRDPFQVMILVTPLLGLAILGLAIRRRRCGSAWMTAGSVIFLATVVNDSLHYQRVINSTDLSGLGFAGLAVGYSAALALRLFRSERGARDRLAGLNASLEDIVAERTASLAEAKGAAERASLAKSEFLAMMSHEIRTPLHGWQGLCELLAETGLDDRQRGYVEQLRRTADDLSSLLGDIIDLARIEAGRFALERVPFDLIAAVKELAAAGGARARERGLAFDLDLAPGLPAQVLGDPAVVRRLVSNFLDNAVKFTERGMVRLTVEPDAPGLVRFTVSDTGCGIDSERQADIFDPFIQVDSSSRRLHAGSGLGLGLCKRLALLAGGRVGVDSAPARGSSFWCVLPLPPAPRLDGQAAGGHSLPRGLTVLVADDVDLNRIVLRGFLAGAGAVVDEARDGAEAVDLFRAGRYDLVVLDLRMPGMDGFEAARAIRAHEAERGGERTPLAALSAGAAAEDRRQSLEAGFDVFLGKPIERDALLSELAALLPEGAGDDDLPPPPEPPQGLEHLMPVFVAEMERDAASVKALAAGDRAQLAEAAHAMRGKAGMFGETLLYDLLTEIEEGAEVLNQESLDEIVGRVVERASQLKVYDLGPHPGPS